MDQQIIDHLKSTYPEVISSDQLYKICRSSKRTVRYYLENNFIPCIDSGKKTRRYQIRLDDVIAFLFEREENPALYKPRQNYYAGQKKTKRVKVESRTNNIDLALLREFLLEYLSEYEDVISPKEVSDITGYSLNTVSRWCTEGTLKCFYICNRIKIPKEYLTDFLASERGVKIVRKSDKHLDILLAFFDYKKEHKKKA